MEGIERMDQGMQPDSKTNTPFQSHVGDGAGNAVTPPHLGGHLNKTHIDYGAIDYLAGEYGVKTMLDIGCGPGGMREAAGAHLVRWHGVDGDPTICGADIHRWDYTRGVRPSGMSYDLAWSVEFVEHVEPPFIGNYMADFIRARYAVITYAQPDTPGSHSDYYQCAP